MYQLYAKKKWCQIAMPLEIKILNTHPKLHICYEVAVRTVVIKSQVKLSPFSGTNSCWDKKGHLDWHSG